MHRVLSHINGSFRGRQGTILILGAVIFTSLLVMSGVVVDLGQAYVQNSELQKTADAAAFAAATLLPIQVSNSVDQAAAEVLAREYLAKNDPDEAEFVGIDFGDTFTDSEEGELYTSVRVRLQRPVNYIFGPIIGLDGTTLSRHAKVRIEAVIGGIGLAPLGISKERRDATAEGEVVAITFAPTDEEVLNGTFGSLDLDGTAGGASSFEERFINGYFGDIVLNDPDHFLDSENGVMFGKAKSGFDARYAQCTHFPDQGGCTQEHYVSACPRIIMIVIYERIEPHKYKPLGFAPYLLDRFEDKKIYVYPLTLKVKTGTTIPLNDFNYDFGLYRTRLVE